MLLPRRGLLLCAMLLRRTEEVADAVPTPKDAAINSQLATQRKQSAKRGHGHSMVILAEQGSDMYCCVHNPVETVLAYVFVCLDAPHTFLNFSTLVLVRLESSNTLGDAAQLSSI